MRAAWVISLVLAVVSTTAQAQPSTTSLRGMAGENDALYWQAVGRLDAKGIGFCTATLISPELVLTAAHCVYSKRTGLLVKPEDLTFRAGLRQGNVAAERPVAQIEPHTGYVPTRGTVLQNIQHDVALLRLKEPIPTSELDPFILQGSAVSTGPVSVVSYGRNREMVPSRQDVCQVMGTQNGVMFMDCDVTFGSSGAPVFSHSNGRGQIVSVISGMGVYDGQRVAYGMVLPKLVAELKHQMWANKPKPLAQIRRVTIGSGGGALSSSGAKFVRP
ncbi:MAG: serine protease [Roseobacter sp.]